MCGIRETDLVQAARWFAGLDTPYEPRKPVLSLYCQGLNQSSSGTAKNAALINLHLATGQIGKPGAGPFSLTGQPNAMGGREVGGLANLLSAHRDLSNAEHRAEVARLWNVADVPSKPGKTAVEMFEAVADGEIKALWIACTNPAQSMPDVSAVRRALEVAEFVVVQEAFATTATCAYADLLLPASTWGEKDGTVTNSERRISRVRSAMPAVGEARDDWRIAADFARRLEARLQPGGQTRFAYPSPEWVWNEHRESTRGRDLDITGLTYAALEIGAAAMAIPRRRCDRPRAALRRRHLPDRRRPCDLRRHGVRQARRAARRALPVLAQHRPPARPMARHEPHRHDRSAVRPRARAVDRDARAGRATPRDQGRRSGAGHLQARLDRPARARERAAGAGAGLHRNALG